MIKSYDEVEVSTLIGYQMLKGLLESTVVKVLSDENNDDYEGMPQVCILIDGKLYNINYCADYHEALLKMIEEECEEI